MVSVAVFTWFLTVGRADLAQYRGFGEVFDIQARALLDGRLSVPDGSLAFEGFVVDGRTYAYFGILPALLRLPVFLVTDRLDGRLSALSMLVAYGLALWSAFAVVARVRALLRPGAPWTRPGLVAAGALLAVIGLGSNLLFLASGAWVYHEASLWGAAGVLGAFAATLRYVTTGRLRSVAVAGLWALVAWTSRGSVGLAPSIVLGLLGLARLTGHPWLSILVPPPSRSAVDHLGSDADADADADDGGGAADLGSGAQRPSILEPAAWAVDRRAGAALLAAAVLGAVVFGSVNTAKFGSPTALPMDKQVASQHPWPERRRALEVYDGSLFSARLIPSVVYQSLRPDLVEPTAVWPFLRFTGKRPPTPDGLIFDTVEPSAGLTVTAPLLLVLAPIGVVAALRRRRPGSDAAVLRPFLLGGLAAAYAPLTIAFIAQRYITDALPLLIVASAGGLAAFDRWAARRADADRRPHRAAAASLVVLATFGILATAAVTWSFQRFVIPPDPAARAAGLRAQVAAAEVVGRPPDFRRTDRLPARAAEPGLVVLGDCRGLYEGQTNGDWSAIEVSGTGGHHRLSVDYGGSPAGRLQALIWIGDSDDHLVVAVSGPPAAARFTLIRNGAAGRPGDPVDLSGGGRTVDIEADPTFAWVKVFADGEPAAFAPTRPPATTDAVIGRGGSDDDTVRLDPPPRYVRRATPTCDALVDSSD